MKTDLELNEIAKRICNQGWVNVANATHLKELRSIQIDALRHAREMAFGQRVDNAAESLMRDASVAQLDKLIRELELK